MAQQTINIGTSPNKGDGDPLRTAFDKINDNFDELYNNVSTLQSGGSTSINSGSTLVVNAVQGSVIGDDSSVILDATTSTVDASKLTGPLPAIDGSALTGITVSALDGDMTGSVFGDNSTLLVDGVNGKIVGDIQNNLIETNNITALPGDTDLYIQGGINSGTPGNPARVNIGTTNTSTISLGAGNTNIYLNGNASSEVAAGTGRFDTIIGDLTGSVFGDDSTLLVDGVNGTIPAANLTGALPAIDGSALTGVTAIATSLDGDVTGSVFADDSTLLVDGVGGTIAGPISSTNWMAASDSYLTISNGGSTGPGPIQIVASANLDLSSGNNNDINITPHGSGRVKVSDGAFGIVESATFIGHADKTMYLSSKTTGAESTHIALDSQSGVATTMYGAVDFVSGGSVDFTGSTVTGLNVTGDITGSIFADDSTLLVDGVNGTVNISNQSINDLSDVDTAIIAPSRDTQPLVWDTVDGNWYPGNGISISAIARIETGGILYFDASSSMVFEGTTANNFETTITASDPSQDNAIVIPDASGTLALTSTTLAGYGITDAYTKAEVDNSIADVTAGHFDFNITGDDSTVRTVSSGSTIGIVGGTGITTASDVDGNITITASGGGGSGLQSRGTVTGTTSSLADAAEADLDITGFKSYALLAITTDRAARVRLYVSDATRTADASRAEGVDPTSDAGLIAEVITTGADTVIISPGAYGFNLESTPTTTIPCRVTNKSGVTATVQVTLNILQLEA